MTPSDLTRIEAAITITKRGRGWCVELSSPYPTIEYISLGKHVSEHYATTQRNAIVDALARLAPATPAGAPNPTCAHCGPERACADHAAPPAAGSREARLEAALREALAALNEYGPAPGHRGACGPEAGCDGLCVDAAEFARHIAQWHAALAPAPEPRSGEAES